MTEKGIHHTDVTVAKPIFDEPPEEIKDLLGGSFRNGGWAVSKEVGEAIIEAFNRGLRKSKG